MMNHLTAQYLHSAVCKLCNVSDVQRFYDTDDSSCKACKEHMAQKVIFTWALLATLTVSALCFHRYGRGFYRKFKFRYARTLTKWKPLKNWLRIVWGAYQMFTKIPTIYQLSLPSSVSDFIASVSPAIDLGLGGVATVPLQCLGFEGYLPQLVFVMILPLVSLAFAYPVVVTRGNSSTQTRSSKRSSKAIQVANHMQQELPLALFISFLAFPVVSTQA